MPSYSQSSHSTAPPSYHTGNPTVKYPRLDEAAPLLALGERKARPRTLLYGAAASAVVIFLLGFSAKSVTLPESPADWQRQYLEHQTEIQIWNGERARWDREQAEHLLELERWDVLREKLRQERVDVYERRQEVSRQEVILQDAIRLFDRQRVRLEKDREMISKERGVHDVEKMVWVRDRAAWARDRDDWEIERRRRDEEPSVYPYDAYWDAPVSSKQCHSYGKREYSARLWGIPWAWGWMEACAVTPVRIDGTIINRPDRCEDHGFWGGVVGYWTVDEDEPLCRPHFGTKHDLGCTNSSVRMLEAPLLDLQSGDDWEVMCHTTPDEHEERPAYCVQKPHRKEKVAVWESLDATC